MTTPNQCQFWSCDQTIRNGHFLCGEHYRQFTDGSINKCPSCGIYKFVRFDVCYNCYWQPTAAQASARPDAARRGDRELTADQKANEFFVYILNLDGGEYYVGQTHELHERMLEHRNNMNRAAAGAAEGGGVPDAGGQAGGVGQRWFGGARQITRHRRRNRRQRN